MNAIDDIRVRIYGQASQPTLIYLPGLHGDWSLLGPFRHALAGRVRLVEVGYPPTSAWSLADHARELENTLAAHGITQGWVLGESFSSQVVWPLLTSSRLTVKGVILAGGFGRHPVRLAARLAEWLMARMPPPVIHALFSVYAKISAWRFRRHPTTVQDIKEFIRRFDHQERNAAAHRLHLVAQSDPRKIVQHTTVPVYALTGFWDPVVPWPAARRWLRRHCPTLSDYRVLWHADHNVLGTASEAAASLVLQWMRSSSVS